MSALVFLIASLATFRLARMFSQEEGLMGMFTHMRRQVPAKTNPGRGIRCPFCLSMHFAALLTGYLCFLQLVPLEYSPLYAFALSGASVLLHRAQADC